MGMTKSTPTPADESPANDDAKYAALQREFAELGQQIAQTKTNWEDQAEADDAKKLLDRHKALAHRLYRPPTPADLIGKFFQDADTILTFAVARPIRPFIHCVKGDPGYSAEQKSLDDYRDKMADHGWKTDGFLKLLHEDADRLADALASIGEDCKPVLEFCQMIPVSPGGHFLFKTAPVWAKLRELWPWLEGIRRRIVANDPQPAKDGKKKLAKGASKKNSTNTDRVTVQQAADVCGKTKGRISQLCNEGEITCWGKGSKRKVSLVSAQAYFAKTAMKRTSKSNAVLARDARKDARDEKRDTKRLGPV